MRRVLLAATGLAVAAVAVPNVLVALGGSGPVTSDGIPARDIFTDHAGFDTWDSSQRAKRVFGVTDAVVVTQRFHMARALYDARHSGLNVTGFAADRRDYGHVMRKLEVREAAARVKAVADVVTGASPRFLGARIPISGDGRESWGPPVP